METNALIIINVHLNNMLILLPENVNLAQVLVSSVHKMQLTVFHVHLSILWVETSVLMFVLQDFGKKVYQLKFVILVLLDALFVLMLLLPHVLLVLLDSFILKLELMISALVLAIILMLEILLQELVICVLVDVLPAI